jgi:transposase
LLHIGELPGLHVPTVAEETARDLVRAREDTRGDLMRARHRVSKLLLRQGIVYSGGTTWTAVHQQWLHAQRFDQPGLQIAYTEALDAVWACADRRDRLDAAIAELAHQPPWAVTVARLECIRGIATLTGFGLTVEIGDWHRFTGASIVAYLGLVPSESSSGGTRSHGPITKAATPTPGVAGRGRLAPPPPDQRAQPHPTRPPRRGDPSNPRPGPSRRHPPAPPAGRAQAGTCRSDP